jgi:deoxyadenosine/deoxycytidine kinase
MRRVYDSLYGDFVPDAILYLKVSPETAHRRMTLRGRGFEKDKLTIESDEKMYELQERSVENARAKNRYEETMGLGRRYRLNAEFTVYL